MIGVAGLFGGVFFLVWFGWFVSWTYGCWDLQVF